MSTQYATFPILDYDLNEIDLLTEVVLIASGDTGEVIGRSTIGDAIHIRLNDGRIVTRIVDQVAVIESIY